MDNSTLLSLLKEYGADIDGINDRFIGNIDLFSFCLSEFISEEHHEELKRAMNKGDLETAFYSIHAMKGLSGNLGLTPYYKAAVVLTEALRKRSREQAELEYPRVEKELERLRELAKRAEPDEEK